MFGSCLGLTINVRLLHNRINGIKKIHGYYICKLRRDYVATELELWNTLEIFRITSGSCIEFFL